MRKLSARLTLWLAIILAASSLASAQPPVAAPTAFEWQAIGAQARAVQRADATETSLPFAMPHAAVLAASPRKVFAYYFPFFVMSMDNRPIAEDHWSVHYLRREGEAGKYASGGGFVRERPLPVGPWASPYWREINGAIDVLRAQAVGIDAFGVGVQEPRIGQLVRGICDAAVNLAPGFGVFGEPDGGVLKLLPAEDMARTLASFESCPAALRLPDGHGLLAPFAPQTRPVSYWAEVKERLRAENRAVDFIPVLLDPGRYAPDFGPISIAMSFWGWRDPDLITGPRGQTLMSFVRRISPEWMQPISPQDFRPKDAVFWEARNTSAFRAAWMEAINSHASFAHLITWNDYSEATEIAPSSGIQYLFYDLTAYYTAWFKTGEPPAIIRDAVYYCHRTQVFDPDHPPLPTDRPFTRLGDTALANEIEMLAFLTEPSQIEIEIGGQVYRGSAPAGLSNFRAPAAVGTPIFRIYRNQSLVLEKPGDWPIEAAPGAASALYVGGSSTRKFVRIPGQ